MPPVTVITMDGKPGHFIWKRRKMSVSEIIDQWRETGRWWDGERARDFYLVNAPSGSFLLMMDIETDSWYAKPVQ